MDAFVVVVVAAVDIVAIVIVIAALSTLKSLVLRRTKSIRQSIRLSAPNL